MKKDILSWNDVKERYLEFHHLDRFTENMTIDIDFGYWLVNNCITFDSMVCNCSPTAAIIDDKGNCKNCGKTLFKP